MEEFGGFLGWLIIIAYAGTMLNYVLKFVNKRYGKMIVSRPNIKKLMGILMKIFVRWHRYWGFGAVLFLLLHFLLQFNEYGMSITGLIAAAIMIFQVIIGMYGAYLHKKRQGFWFWIHRVIALLLIVGIAAHLLFA